MTDGGALPAWFSRTARRAAPTGSPARSPSARRSAATSRPTNVHSGLLAARHVLRADVAVVTPGAGQPRHRHPLGLLRRRRRARRSTRRPRWAAGRSASLRISDADPRARHRGVSHHSLTAYGRVALAPADLVVPDGLPEPLAAAVDAALAPLGPPHRARPGRRRRAGRRRCAALPVQLSTMGRGLDADHAYFLSAAAAGRHAARLATPGKG